MSTKNLHAGKRATTITYILGFLLSIILTLVAYILVELHIYSLHEAISHALLLPIIIVLAFGQMIVQLLFFLHIGQEKNPRWNLVFFIGTFAGVLLVVIASIWIMNHLNYNMTPEQMKTYILNDEGIH